MQKSIFRFGLKKAGFFGAALFAFAIWATTHLFRGSEEDLGKFCASDTSGARWHSPSTLELCGGKRMEVATPGSPTPPEHMCLWLREASKMRAILTATALENRIWEVRPTKAHMPIRNAAQGGRAGNFSPSDSCKLYERP
jgi:hypothetical protein